VTLYLRGWDQWQKALIGRIQRTRRSKGHSETAPFVMPTVLISTILETDERYVTFSRAVGPRSALTFYVRVLIYAGTKNGLAGMVDVPAEKFGRHVLSTLDDTVSKRIGLDVHNALLSSGLAGEHPFRHASRHASGRALEKEREKEKERDARVLADGKKEDTVLGQLAVRLQLAESGPRISGIRRKTARDLLDVPEHERNIGWAEKAVKALPVVPEHIRLAVFPPEDAAANGKPDA